VAVRTNLFWLAGADFRRDVHEHLLALLRAVLYKSPIRPSVGASQSETHHAYSMSTGKYYHHYTQLAHLPDLVSGVVGGRWQPEVLRLQCTSAQDQASDSLAAICCNVLYDTPSINAADALQRQRQRLVRERTSTSQMTSSGFSQ
jgi:hypothetical protein